MQHTELLIIGAGPYGLAIASYANAKHMDFMIVGSPMSFWRGHMPNGMALRSPQSWHFDAMDRLTFQHFVAVTDRTLASGNSRPLDLFLDYARWYQDRSGLQVEESYVTRLEATNNGFEAFFLNREPVASRHVVVASGLQDFRFVPPDLVTSLGPTHYLHTGDLSEPHTLKGKRCLIVGGRQSAFEWAALLREQAAADVHLVYRHDQPKFVASDWSWIEPMVEASLEEPGWFRHQSKSDREAIFDRFWKDGRLKLEPWLEPRIVGVHQWPHSTISECRCRGSSIDVTLDTGRRVTVDMLLFATGYRVDVTRIPYLQTGSIRSKLTIRDGSPALDESFQSTVPGLFFAGHATVQDFGPFFGFVRGCGPTARIMIDAIQRRNFHANSRNARWAPDQSNWASKKLIPSGAA